jgi:hypothetical protein
VTAAIDGVEYFPDLSFLHVTTPVDYPQIPPVGGQHSAILQNCGLYDYPVSNEQAVHSLEHGAVWITYQPDLPASDITRLAEITLQGTHRLLSPYPGIPSPIVVSAWGYQLKLERADDPRLMQFIGQYEQGPTTPELGAPCSGGAGQPLSFAEADSGAIHQWATSASATSQYSDDSWSAGQATGEPDTFDCGDRTTAWASQTSTGRDVLTVMFAEAVIPTSVHIYQSYNPGAITGIELIPADGGPPIEVTNSADPGGIPCPGVLIVDILSAVPLVNGVNIHLDQTITQNWNEIDAVQLIGNPSRQ